MSGIDRLPASANWPFFDAPGAQRSMDAAAYAWNGTATIKAHSRNARRKDMDRRRVSGFPQWQGQADPWRCGDSGCPGLDSATASGFPMAHRPVAETIT
jgi:hypothetical protein